MKTEVRERLFLPLVLPLAIVAFIGGSIGLFAAIMLWNTREVAVVLALVAAGGVLVAISMLSSRDDLDRPRKGIAVAAGLVPLIIGGAFALSGGGVDDEALLNINREPHNLIPEDAPVIAAINQQWFCDPVDGTCEETHELTVNKDGEAVFVFENREVGTPHNVAVYRDADYKEPIFQGEIITGEATTAYRFNSTEPGEYFFRCDVHPVMTGRFVLTAAGGGGDGTTEAAAG